MDKTGKAELIEELKGALASAELVVISHQLGLDAAQSRAMRAAARANNAGIKVLKNTLAKRAVEGTAFQFLQPHLNGPTVLTWSEDPIGAAKLVGDLTKTIDKIKIVAGGGKDKEMALNDLMALSKLPSMDVLRGKLVGLLVAPASKLARVLALRGEQAA